MPGQTDTPHPELHEWFGNQVISDLLDDMITGIAMSIGNGKSEPERKELRALVRGFAARILELSKAGDSFYLTDKEESWILAALYAQKGG